MQLPTAPVPGVILDVRVTTFDGSTSRVPEDPTSGWSFGDPSQMSIVFNGQWCEEMQAGEIASAGVYYACPIIDLGDELR